MITQQQQATLDWLRTHQPASVPAPAVTLVYLKARAVVIYPNGSYHDMTLGEAHPAPGRA